MSEAKYLILTKASDPSDVEAWGVVAGSLGLAIKAKGTVQGLPDWTILPECVCPILVLNMTFAYLADFLRDDGGKVERIVGASPRVWVHFGDINSADMDVKKMVERWSRAEYSPFRRFTKQPMPYSQAAPAEFDQCVKTLSGTIKGLLGGGTRTTANLSDMDSVLSGLDRAWQMATKTFPEKDFGCEVDTNCDLRVAQDLMPVFIYLDGLLYASEKAEDKIEEMAKVVREGVPEVLGAISVVATSSRAQEISSRKNDLSDVGTVELTELVAKGRQFCDWYRDFLKVIMPESTAKDEPTRETNP